MFGFDDLISLIISAFIILPVTVFLRELGYLIVSPILGVQNPRITLGSGPRLFKFSVFDIRKYYHLYSWFSYDTIKRDGKFAYVLLYASPIVINTILALTINALLANEVLEEYRTFWDRFVFYAFFYVLFDIAPMKTVNGKPNNGYIIYEILRYGRRTDYNNEPFIPSTTEVDEEYKEEMKKIERMKEEAKEAVEEKEDRKQEYIPGYSEQDAEEKTQEKHEEIEEDSEEEKEKLKQEKNSNH